MNVAEIGIELGELSAEPFDAAEFAYRFLEIYKAPSASIAKLRNGRDNKADQDCDLLWKAKFYFGLAETDKTAERLDSLIESKLTSKNKPRIIFTTDGTDYSTYDAKACEYRHGDLAKLSDDFDFFFPVAGIDKYQAVEENKADIQAAGRLSKLHDAILANNPDWASDEMRHQLNLFMTRILFCMFAEDTGIFKSSIFTKLITEFGDQSERNIPDVLNKVFVAMNTPENARGHLPNWACVFPYVNGGLFEETIAIPTFCKRATRTLKEAAQLDWKDINPDIFGSMIQAVVDTEMRGDLGMHYTSVPNIMKVLHPLFLMELEEEFAAAQYHRQEKSMLSKLLQRISKIRVFDPACGSGNFLIIAYRELRKLEMRIYQREDDLNEGQMESRFESVVKLENFYGIEYADFATETAKLSLWIIEYQMNKQFKSIFGEAPPALPLNTGGNIHHGNALTVDWEVVCPQSKAHETYIVGNPPYLGSRNQSLEQKTDVASICGKHIKSFKVLDYVCCWYVLGAQYCKSAQSACAFVATNSICQGQQVPLLWPFIFSLNLEIGFAHKSFKWTNNAAKNAGVICVVVGIRQQTKLEKLLIDGDITRKVDNIGPYLINMPNDYVVKRGKSLSNLAEMTYGNYPGDGNNLTLSPADKSLLIEAAPQSVKYIRRLYGAQEFLKGIERWCLWIEAGNVKEASEIPFIEDRINKTREVRLASKDAGYNKLASRPFQFRDTNAALEHTIVIPTISSERRNHLPIGLLNDNSVTTNQVFALLDTPISYFSLLSSRMHFVWMSVVSGKLKADFRYSSTLVYNTFPVPPLSLEQMQKMEEHAWNIISVREESPGKTIAWLYDPKTMPADLLAAHKALDDTLEKIYIGRPFKNDTERLEHLFKLYAEMISQEAK